MRQQQRDGDWTGRDGRRSERRSERDGRRHCTAQNNNTLCFVFDVFVLLFFPLLLLLLLLFCFDKEKGKEEAKKSTFMAHLPLLLLQYTSSAIFGLARTHTDI